jgi:hypothetical protein
MAMIIVQAGDAALWIWRQNVEKSCRGERPVGSYGSFFVPGNVAIGVQRVPIPRCANVPANITDTKVMAFNFRLSVLLMQV